jgi:hypothetical protein
LGMLMGYVGVLGEVRIPNSRVLIHNYAFQIEV